MTQDRAAFARRWLMTLSAIALAIIFIGGLTRLTGSGLSITEWQPVSGALPPFSDLEWEQEFAKYREIPQFRFANADMDLAGFKVIYWWEWAHRQLGRLFGVVWLVGFLVLWRRFRVSRRHLARYFAIGVLTGVQAGVGWWMVASGLSGIDVRVSATRLAVHLGLGAILLGFLLWLYWDLRPHGQEPSAEGPEEVGALRKAADGLLFMCFLQIFLGALVAGTGAGAVHTDWPFMSGSLLPPSAFEIEPWWENFFWNNALVQFNHRWVGTALLVFAWLAWRRAREVADEATTRMLAASALLILAQAVLGVVTLWNRSPWFLGSAHQMLAMGVVGGLVLSRASLAKRTPQTAPGPLAEE
ncbi:MAG TPA: COX15/CtaA family protein [Fimbriimonadaceae bacterium]|nr:COX15/CtaA family protein [Fimbriimonadaceae bacterium]